MICTCRDLAKCFEPNPDEEFRDFITSVTFIRQVDEYALYTCEKCSQYYAVEQWSRGPLIVKLETKEEFDSFDETPYRKQLFIE